MKNLIYWLLPVFLMLTGFSSCGSNEKVSPPPSIGKIGQVVLVLDDSLYHGPVGDSLLAILTQEEPDLPQTGLEEAEPMFDLMRIPPLALTNLFKSSRNLLQIRVGPDIPISRVDAAKNYWADGQVFIRMEAPDQNSIMKLIQDNRQNIVNILRDAEVDRMKEYAREYRNVNLSDQILCKHQIEISLPQGYQARLDTGNFVWTQFDPPEATYGVLLWSVPYLNVNQLELNSLKDSTNRSLKLGISGPSKGSYMVINQEVSTRTLTVKGDFVRELRGLWSTHGTFMGGPYISWNFVDEKRSRIVTVFGFVYSPNDLKRDKIRKIEGILNTVAFPD
jgi:hypothetical protein